MMSDDPQGSYGLGAAENRAPISAPELPYLPPSPRTYVPRIALIGCGGISEYHLRAYAAKGWNVVALCDRDPRKAALRREQFFPQAKCFGDDAELLAQSDADVVDIALHPAERISVIERALRAGRHVLSQKPFVTDLAVGERLVALAEEKKLRLAVNQNGRWAPHFAYLSAAVAAGVIGEVSSVDFTLQWDHTWTAGTSFDAVHHLVLFDFGIHWFDLVTQFMSGRRPERVWASTRKASYQRMRPPILGQVTIDYPDAQIRMGFNGHVEHGQEDRTVICGSRGTLRSFGPSLSSQTVELSTAAGQCTPPLTGTWFTSGFQGAMGELLCAIEDQREPTNSARSNLASLELCFAAITSADSGRPVVPGQARTLSTSSPL